MTEHSIVLQQNIDGNKFLNYLSYILFTNMEILCSKRSPPDLLNICRTCLNELTMERSSIFKDIEIQTTGKINNQDDDDKTWLRIRIIDIILLCTSNISVNTIE